MSVTGADIDVTNLKTVTSGMAGATVEIEYDDAWSELHKQVVFRTVFGTVNADGTVIPAEILRIADVELKVGIYGYAADGSVAIPTVWASLGKVKSGADPEGDESAKPTLPIWARVQNQIGNLDGLKTKSKANLVAAINELETAGVDEAEIQRIINEYLEDNEIGGKVNWNAAEGETGHIANRTHWVGEPVTKVLLEATFSGEYDHAGLIGLTEGVVYDVTYNGQLYKCKCEKVTTIHPTIGSTLHGYAIGNIAAFTGTGNTGEPFVIGDVSTLIYQGTLYAYNTVVAMQLGGDGSVSIRVSVTTKETHKIDPVYLPESTHGPVATQVPLDITAVEPNFATVVSAAPDEPMSPVFFVKVSDFVPALEEIKQCVLVHNFNGNAFSVSLDDSDPDDDGSRLNYGSFFTVVYDAAKSQEFAAGGNGIYFLYSAEIKTLRLYSDTVTMPGVEYRKIPAQYLPPYLNFPTVTAADAGKTLEFVVDESGNWIPRIVEGI